MASLRYVLALLVVVGAPPALCYWLVIHPWARHWRALGPGPALAVAWSVMLGCMVGLFQLRHVLLARDCGTSPLGTALGVGCIALAVGLFRQLRRQLTLRIQLGLPELAPEGTPAPLLTEGLYARIRHPRYVEMWVALLGWALIANYLESYLVVVLLLPLIHGVVLLEERELRERYGAEYEAYCRRVPRYLPRLRTPSATARGGA